MLYHKGLSACIIVCVLFSACIYSNESTPSPQTSPPVQTSDCSQETKQMGALIESLHNKANTMDMKNKELVSLNAYLKHKSDKMELEILKRDALIQIQGNVIKLLDDAEKTIETGLKDEVKDKMVELEEARKNTKLVYTTEELFIAKTLDISNGGQKKLLAVADSIKQNKKQMIFIEGHTDNVPVSPALKERFPSNWEISIARAAAVAHFLHTKVDIDPERIVVVGHGAFKPVASNSTEQGRKENRRVEIILGPPL